MIDCRYRLCTGDQVSYFRYEILFLRLRKTKNDNHNESTFTRKYIVQCPQIDLTHEKWKAVPQTVELLLSSSLYNKTAAGWQTARTVPAVPRATAAHSVHLETVGGRTMRPLAGWMADEWFNRGKHSGRLSLKMACDEELSCCQHLSREGSSTLFVFISFCPFWCHHSCPYAVFWDDESFIKMWSSLDVL